MKSWTTATGDDPCSYCGRRWKAGARIFEVRGSGPAKQYDAECAIARHGASADTGEVLDVTDVPAYPAVLKPVYQTPAPEEALFAEPFEEDKPLPFDGRAAALPVGDRD